MTEKRFGIRLLPAALWLISLGAGSAYAAYEWNEDFTSGSLAPNWTTSFPQTSDGYIANTGLDDSAIYEFGIWHAGYVGELKLWTVTGAPAANRHLWNITRDAVGVGSSDFVAKLEFMVPKCWDDILEMGMKLVDSNGYVVAGAYWIDPVATNNRFDLGYVVDLDESDMAPRDYRDPSGAYDAVQQRVNLGGIGGYGIMEIVRDATGDCTFTFATSATGVSGSYVTHYTYDMGNTLRMVKDLQISLGWTDTSRDHPWYLGRVEISSQSGATPSYLPGDASRDRVVDAEDAAILATNWQATGADWGMGDFNNDGVVNDVDATLMATNWGQTSASSAASVPEPSLLVFPCALFAMLALRRRT